MLKYDYFIETGARVCKSRSVIVTPVGELATSISVSDATNAQTSLIKL